MRQPKARMLNTQSLVVEHFTCSLEAAYRRTYGTLRPEIGSVISWAGRLSLENIGNSDMLYHNLEHTMLVASVGQEILISKQLTEGGVSPTDWLNFMLALLFHDIGYVRGICRQDKFPQVATGGVRGHDSQTVELPAGSTDAALTPYHVSRSQLFMRERFGGKTMMDIDIDTICSYIEMTRFPPPTEPEYKHTHTYGGLVRAADFIGQLGDPNYLRKIPALFYEFEQIGTNKTLGYANPEAMRAGFATFYWSIISPYLKDALRYLRTTQEGRQWIANLQSHVFEVEHFQRGA